MLNQTAGLVPAVFVFEPLSALILRSPPQAGVSKDEGGPMVLDASPRDAPHYEAGICHRRGFTRRRSPNAHIVIACNLMLNSRAIAISSRYMGNPMGLVKGMKAAKKPDFNGKWKNELDSVMELVVKGPSITGTYTSAVSSDGSATPPHPLIGNVDNELISFVVNWIDYSSITAWVGQMVVDTSGKEQIFTMWQMTTTTKDPENKIELWQAILAGSDTFSRLP